MFSSQVFHMVGMETFVFGSGRGRSDVWICRDH